MGFPMAPSVEIIIYEPQLKSIAQAGVPGKAYLGNIGDRKHGETWGQTESSPVFIAAGNPGERPRIFLALPS